MKEQKNPQIDHEMENLKVMPAHSEFIREMPKRE